MLTRCPKKKKLKKKLNQFTLLPAMDGTASSSSDNRYNRYPDAAGWVGVSAAIVSLKL